MEDPLSLTDLRGLESRIAKILGELEAEHGKPLYLPFQLRGDGLRATQGYLTKMPAALVEALPKLPHFLEDLPATFSASPSTPEGREPGQTYNTVDVSAPQVQRDPFSVDPAAVERGLKSHGDLQNLLAKHVASLGFRPRSPEPLDPPWDLLWLNGDEVWIAEIKSLTRANEERQLRLGLGQVLIYRQRLQSTHSSVKAVLMVEWKPLDPDWHALCESLGVVLLWPNAISGLDAAPAARAGAALRAGC